MGHEHTEHALTTNLACIFKKKLCLLEKMKEKCIPIQKQIIMKILEYFDANLKRLLWNGFCKSQRESDSRTHVGFQSLWVHLI